MWRCVKRTVQWVVDGVFTLENESHAADERTFIAGRYGMVKVKSKGDFNTGLFIVPDLTF